MLHAPAAADDVLELAFTNDTNVYFLPILKCGLAVRHVAVLVKKSFGILDDVVICKPRTRVPLPGSLMLFPNAAVSAYIATGGEKHRVVSCESEPGVSKPDTTPTPTPTTRAYAELLHVRIDAVIDPMSRRGLVGYCIYVPVKSACWRRIRETIKPTLCTAVYDAGAESRNASACEMRALVDVLHVVEARTDYEPGKTKIVLLCASTYGVQAINSVVRAYESFVGDNATYMAALRDIVVNRHADVRAQWPTALTDEFNTPCMATLRRYAVAMSR